MKEKIQKFAADLAEAVKLLKEEDVEGATTALESAAEGIEALEKEATEAEETIEKSKTEIAKSVTDLATANETIEKSAEEIKKWASLNVGADTMSALLTDIGSVKTMLSDSVGIAKSTNESLEAIDARLETIEKAKEEKQLREETREQMMEKAMIPGLNLTPRN